MKLGITCIQLLVCSVLSVYPPTRTGMLLPHYSRQPCIMMFTYMIVCRVSKFGTIFEILDQSKNVPLTNYSNSWQLTVISHLLIYCFVGKMGRIINFPHIRYNLVMHLINMKYNSKYSAFHSSDPEGQTDPFSLSASKFFNLVIWHV